MRTEVCHTEREGYVQNGDVFYVRELELEAMRDDEATQRRSFPRLEDLELIFEETHVIL